MREQWSSQTGFYLACIGSAVGLGNIWRFPYIVGENGGGAFLIPYAIITVSFGLVFMMIEIAVGRFYQTSVISSMMNIGKHFKWGGYVLVVVSFCIVGYYLVVLGWVFAFLVFILSGTKLDFDAFTNSWYPVLAFLTVLGITFYFVRRGISKGVEIINKVGILMLVAMLLPLAIYGMMLPGAENGIAYYLTPNFERLSDSSVWSTAFGQVFFSLSIGAGILLTYGSYIKNKESILKSSLIIVVSNATVSFVAGLMIFSFIFSFGMEPDGGVSLIFRILPMIFETMDYGMGIGSLFFFLILIAGLTSAVSMFQVPVAALTDQKKISTKKSSYITGAFLALFGGIITLSYTPANLELFEMPLLDLMDLIIGTYGLLISGAVFIVIVTWFIDIEKFLVEINIGSRIKLSHRMFKVIKFVFPTVLILAMVLTL